MSNDAPADRNDSSLHAPCNPDTRPASTLAIHSLGLSTLSYALGRRDSDGAQMTLSVAAGDTSVASLV